MNVPAGSLAALLLPDGARLEARFRKDLLGGVAVVTGRAESLARAEDGTVRRDDVRLMNLAGPGDGRRLPGRCQGRHGVGRQPGSERDAREDHARRSAVFPWRLATGRSF